MIVEMLHQRNIAFSHDGISWYDLGRSEKLRKQSKLKKIGT